MELAAVEILSITTVLTAWSGCVLPEQEAAVLADARADQRGDNDTLVTGLIAAVLCCTAMPRRLLPSLAVALGLSGAASPATFPIRV